jgi:hypothetical protein
MLNKEKYMQPKKVNVSINPDTMKVLSEMRLKLSQELGFVPSYSQVIQHLLKNSEQSDKRVDMLVKDLMEGSENE